MRTTETVATPSADGMPANDLPEDHGVVAVVRAAQRLGGHDPEMGHRVEPEDLLVRGEPACGLPLLPTAL